MNITAKSAAIVRALYPAIKFLVQHYPDSWRILSESEQRKFDACYYNVFPDLYKYNREALKLVSDHINQHWSVARCGHGEIDVSTEVDMDFNVVVPKYHDELTKWYHMTDDADWWINYALTRHNAPNPLSVAGLIALGYYEWFRAEVDKCITMLGELPSELSDEKLDTLENVYKILKISGDPLMDYHKLSQYPTESVNS